MIGLIVWLAMAAGQGQSGSIVVGGGDAAWDKEIGNWVSCLGEHPPKVCLPDDPIDVPAVRKTRKVYERMPDLCKVGSNIGSETVAAACLQDESYWDCADPDRVLLVSVNGKQAVCHKITEEK